MALINHRDDGIDHRPVRSTSAPCRRLPTRAVDFRAVPSTSAPCRRLPPRAVDFRAVPSTSAPCRRLPRRAVDFRPVPTSAPNVVATKWLRLLKRAECAELLRAMLERPQPRDLRCVGDVRLVRRRVCWRSRPVQRAVLRRGRALRQRCSGWQRDRCRLRRAVRAVRSSGCGVHRRHGLRVLVV